MFKIRDTKSGLWFAVDLDGKSQVKWSVWRDHASGFERNVDAVEVCIRYKLYGCEIVGRRQ